MNTARPDFLDVLVHAPGSDVAVEDRSRSIDYTGLASKVHTVVSLLREHGVRPGDRVVVSLANSISSVEAYLGCAALGAIWVGVNASAPVQEKTRQCEIVVPQAVIATDDGYVPAGAELILVGDGGLVADRCDSLPERPALDAPCAIAFSSGTTGKPKAIVHSRAAVSLAAAALAATTLRSADRVGVTLPCSILNVMIVGPLTSLIAGATTVLLDAFTARAVAAECHERRLTMVRALVPATVYDLVHDDGIIPECLATLREAGTGAAGLAETLRVAFETKFGVRMSGSYGLSEAPAAVCCENTGRPRRPGSSGVPLPHVSVTIRGQAGMPMPTGQLGDVWVGPAPEGPWTGQHRGALGHWADGRLIPASCETIGFATGDVGSLDDEGALHVVGRAGDAITRGGVTVAAPEIEAVIGGFAGVRAVAVVGRPHDRLGEQIVAFVQAEDGHNLDPATVRRHAAIVVSHGKVPDEVIIVDALPRNTMGKVAKAELARSLFGDAVRE